MFVLESLSGGPLSVNVYFKELPFDETMEGPALFSPAFCFSFKRYSSLFLAVMLLLPRDNTFIVVASDDLSLLFFSFFTPSEVIFLFSALAGVTLMPLLQILISLLSSFFEERLCFYMVWLRPCLQLLALSLRGTISWIMEDYCQGFSADCKCLYSYLPST